MQRTFFSNLVLLLVLNLLIKPIWILGVEVGVQRILGPEVYGNYFVLLNFSFLFMVLMDFGLVIFMAAVGLGAGAGIVEALQNAGLKLALAGVLVTLVPPMVAYLFGRSVFKMNPALLLGAVTGAMTSTPALSVVTQAARSHVPAIVTPERIPSQTCY